MTGTMGWSPGRMSRPTLTTSERKNLVFSVRRARRSSLFSVKMNKDYYIYESNRYRDLGRMYDALVEEAGP